MNMYNKGAGTFVCLQPHVRVMSWMPFMEGRSCCCSRPNQIKVVHYKHCNPPIPSIYTIIYLHKRCKESIVDTATEKRGSFTGTTVNQMESKRVEEKKEDMQMVEALSMTTCRCWGNPITMRNKTVWATGPWWCWVCAFEREKITSGKGRYEGHPHTKDRHWWEAPLLGSPWRGGPVQGSRHGSSRRHGSPSPLLSGFKRSSMEKRRGGGNSMPYHSRRDSHHRHHRSR